MQHRFQNVTCRAGQAAPKVILPTLALPLVPQPCSTKVSYIARTLSKDISCRAGQVRVLFCLPDCRFLPNSLATGQVVILHAGQVEIVAIVMPLIFGQSLLILCCYFTNIFTQVQRGAAPALRISREKGSFFKTSACPRFCKRRVLFCTQVRSMGVKIPLQSTKYTRL